MEIKFYPKTLGKPKQNWFQERYEDLRIWLYDIFYVRPFLKRLEKRKKQQPKRFHK